MTDLDLLRQATDVTGDEVRQLRLRVSKEIARRNRRAWFLWPALAAAVASAVLTVVYWPVPDAETLTVSLPAPAPPSVAASMARKPRPAPRKPPEPVVIQLETPDPDVVIYLVSSDGGGE